MKKSLAAMAALALAGVASAQSSVTLFGLMDVGISGYSNKSEDTNWAVGHWNRGSVNAKKTAMSTSGLAGSRLGFRGTEDLGGGLAASFWLEAGLNNDDGSGNANGGLSFNRRSTVSLSGNFGEIRLGRDYTPTFWNDTNFTPFGTNGVGTNLISSANGYTTDGVFGRNFNANTNYVRANNSIGYFLPPNLGGLYGQLMYALDEQSSVTDVPGSRAGRYIGGRLGYAKGPLDVALAYGESSIAAKNPPTGFSHVTDQLATWNLGASYDFGVVKLFGEYSNVRLKQDNVLFNSTWRQRSADGWLLGVTAPVGPGLIRAAYSAVNYKNTGAAIIPGNPLAGFAPDMKANKFALGYVYNLSKRTAIYTTVARVSNKDGADLSVGGPSFVGATDGSMTAKSSTGYDFGIRHSF